MFCSKCGKLITHENARFCDGCGAELNYVDSAPQAVKAPDPVPEVVPAEKKKTAKKKRSAGKLLLILLLVLLLVVGLAVGLWMLYQHTDIDLPEPVVSILERVEELLPEKESEEELEEETQEIDRSEEPEETPAPTPAEQEPSVTAETTPVPIEEEPVSMDAITVTGIDASAVLHEKGYDYSPENMLDKDLSTCWAANGSVGLTITMILSQKESVSGIQLCNGYGIDDTRYYNNNRVTGLRFTFDDGKSEELYLDQKAAEADYKARWLTTMEFMESHETKTIRMEVVAVERGEKFDDTCISELYPIKGVTSHVEAAAVETVTLPGGQRAPAKDFIFPDSSTRKLTEADLDDMFGYTEKDWAKMGSQRALNEIYARYGYRFHPEKSETARDAYDYFNSLDWYQEISPGTAYTDTSQVPVNSIENANIQMIAQWQKNKGLR